MQIMPNNKKLEVQTKNTQNHTNLHKKNSMSVRDKQQESENVVLEGKKFMHSYTLSIKPKTEIFDNMNIDPNIHNTPNIPILTPTKKLLNKDSNKVKYFVRDKGKSNTPTPNQTSNIDT